MILLYGNQARPQEKEVSTVLEALSFCSKNKQTPRGIMSLEKYLDYPSDEAHEFYCGALDIIQNFYGQSINAQDIEDYGLSLDLEALENLANA